MNMNTEFFYAYGEHIRNGIGKREEEVAPRSHRKEKYPGTRHRNSTRSQGSILGTLCTVTSRNQLGIKGAGLITPTELSVKIYITYVIYNAGGAMQQRSPEGKDRGLKC